MSVTLGLVYCRVSQPVFVRPPSPCPPLMLQVWQDCKLHVQEITITFSGAPVCVDSSYDDVRSQCRMRKILGELQALPSGSILVILLTRTRVCTHYYLSVLLCRIGDDSFRAVCDVLCDARQSLQLFIVVLVVRYGCCLCHCVHLICQRHRRVTHHPPPHTVYTNPAASHPHPPPIDAPAVVVSERA